jgi:Type I phosphodiesterase / nucleotide pyrophosphatase
MRVSLAAGLAIVAMVTAIVLGTRARQWNSELGLAAPPLSREPPRLDDPRTPRLAERVVLVIIDGLGAAEAGLPYLDELRRRGVDATARVPYPTVSRPGYVTILTGVPPRDSGVRANRVVAPVAVDTVMDRVQAAGLRVASASNYGTLVSLFLRNTSSISGVPYTVDGTRLTPPAPLSWPIDDARRVRTLDAHGSTLPALGATLAELVAGDAAFLAILVLDVDRAGHAEGVGEGYRAAAQAVDRTLRTAFAGLDLARDTVIVTADHGHVAPGGHGGDEPEVSVAPLVLAGAGIRPGARAHDPGLVDVAPTVAALLGLPGPGHAEGRALVELLQLPPDAAARRAALDDARARALGAVADAARAGTTAPDPVRLVELAAALAAAAALSLVLRRRGAIALGPGALCGVLAVPITLLAIVVITRGRISPSYVPALARTLVLGAVGAMAAVAVQVLASWRIVRRAPDPLAAACGVALVGLVTAHTTALLLRAWFSPPHLDLPPPFWMVMVPTMDLAAATCALATIPALALGWLRRDDAPPDAASPLS